MKVPDHKRKIYYISELYCLVSIMLMTGLVIKGEDTIRYMLDLLNDEAVFVYYIKNSNPDISPFTWM